MIVGPLARSLRAQPAAGLGVVSLAALALAALAMGVLGYDPVLDVNPDARGLAASSTHWLGTDPVGRDVFRRLLAGASSFLLPGAVAAAVSMGLGVPLGALAAWWAGASGALIRYLLATLSSIPPLVLALLACSSFGNDLLVLGAACGLAYVPTVGEAVFARVEALRAREYVLASRAYGLPDWRILWVHLVLVGCGPLLARQLALVLGHVLVIEASLSYIGGFGVQEPEASWGNMLAFAWGRGGEGWAWGAPALALWLTALALAAAANVGAEDDRAG